MNVNGMMNTFQWQSDSENLARENDPAPIEVR